MYKPTLEQYRELGLEMKKMRLRLMNLDKQGRSMFGKTKFDLFYVMKRFDTIKSQTEELMFSNPPEGLEDMDKNDVFEIFYGDSELYQEMKDSGELPSFGDDLNDE